MEHYSALKKNEILPFAKTWMNLEEIMLMEIGTESQILHDFMHTVLYVESKEKNRKKSNTQM